VLVACGVSATLAAQLASSASLSALGEAGSALGVDIAGAVLKAGHAVVATGRYTELVAAAVGEYDDLLVLALDVTDPPRVRAAVDSALQRFGRIDVLVSCAGSSLEKSRE
jgi:NADP-dependent 3-hydroxy acid dehydrogenase YdfG